MTYGEWMELVSMLKDIHKQITSIQHEKLNSHTIHSALMCSDQAEWIHQTIVTMLYKTASLNAKHEATS